MTQSLQHILGVLVALALAYAFYRYTQRRASAQATSAELLFADVMQLLDGAQKTPGESIGSWKVTGRYHNEVFQFHTITDTLSVRKLPSLWLMVTLPKPQPLEATFDLMMRPAAQSTFSKFDFLPHTIELPEGFPVAAVIRSDANSFPPEAAMRKALGLFHHGKGKELLLSPKGLRLVVQLAESEKARYGVYREARFSNAIITSSLASEIMNTLLQLDKDIATTHG